MLPSNLVTNEVKDRAGVEVEFNRIASADRRVEFQKVNEIPSSPHRISVNHQDIGSGTTRRRRSVVRIDKTISGHIDTSKAVTISAYVVLDAPVGNVINTNDMKDTLANLISLTASTGATTTILYDCTGHGASALINGEL